MYFDRVFILLALVACVSCQYASSTKNCECVTPYGRRGAVYEKICKCRNPTVIQTEEIVSNTRLVPSVHTYEIQEEPIVAKTPIVTNVKTRLVPSYQVNTYETRPSNTNFVISKKPSYQVVG